MKRVQQFLLSWTGTYLASRCRPPLPPVEPELRMPRPRPSVWVFREGTLPWIKEMMHQWRAVRAWVYEYSEWRDSDGPEIRARYAFDAEDGTLAFGAFSGSYDGFHLALNRDFCSFLDRAVCKGGTFTVLHPPGKPWESRVYGDYEPRLYVPVVELARRLAALGPEANHERDALREQLLSVFLSLSEFDYHKMMQSVIGQPVHLERHDDYARKALEAVESGTAHAEALMAVQKKQAGRWAAT